MPRNRISLTTLLLSLIFLAPMARSQDLSQEQWKDFKDSYGTFTVSCPEKWEAKQTRPGEIEVKGSDQTWVRISTLGTLKGEGATAKEEVISFIGTLPEGFRSKGFSQLSFNPDRAVWAYVIVGKEVTVQGTVAVEVNGILHYGVAYQFSNKEGREISSTFKRIVSSFRAGQFKLPDWIYGGENGPLPTPVATRPDSVRSKEGTFYAEFPKGWNGKGADKRIDLFQNNGPARLTWQLSEMPGEKQSAEKLVAGVLAVESIEALEVKEQRLSEVRLFPVPKKPTPPPTKEKPDPDADVPYQLLQRMGFTFTDKGGVDCRGYAMVILDWTKKKPQPYRADVLIFWTARDKFASEAETFQEIAASLYSRRYGEWQGTHARRDLYWLANETGEEETSSDKR